MRPALLLAAILTWAPSPALPAAVRAAAEDDPATARWDQYGGNSARTFASSVEPVRTAPRVLWKSAANPESLGDTVAWDGTLYSCQGATLYARSLADGRVLAKKDLGKGGSHIAVAQGMVVVANAASLRGFQLQGSGFTLRWTAKGDHSCRPAVREDVVFSHSPAGMAGFDPVTGKVVEPIGAFARRSPPVLTRDGGRLRFAGVSTGPLSGYVGHFAFLGDPFSANDREFGFFREEGEAPAVLSLCRISASGEEPAGWLLHSSSPLAGKEGDVHGSVLTDRRGKEDGGLVPLASPPTVYRGRAVGFAEDGSLVSIRADGRFFELVNLQSLPPGTRPGPASRARHVAYLGNWALDLDTRRVLWSLPDLRPGGPLLPVEDRVLVAVTETGQMLCLTDRPDGGAESPAGGTAAPSGAPCAAAAGPPLPGDGLLLADGTSVEGPVEALPGGRFRAAPPGGAPRECAAADLLLARGGGKVLHRGRESAVLARWRRTLHPGAVDALMGIHLRMAKDGLHEAAAAVLADARAFGLPEDRAAEATRKAVAVKPSNFPAKILGELEPGFRKVRTSARDGFLDASDWCVERGFPAAAACLLLDATRMLPGDGVSAARVPATVPLAFPWRDDTDSGQRWLAWAQEIVQADGEFVPADHPLRKSITAGPWSASEPVVVLRTPNTVFRSRFHDPAVVGRCLRNAEFTCRALSFLIGAGEVAPVRNDADRMDVRLHRDEKEFRAEDAASGGGTTWSAGYYTSGEGVSRFFVPGKDSRDALGRGLFEVLAHELTHHFLDRRWTATRGGARGGAAAPGYWAIEGIARFVEDQAVEMDRRGLRFDDRTAPSLEAAAQAAGQKVLFRPVRLLEMSRTDFGKLTTKELLRVRLRNTIEGRILDPIGLFYEQAGATAYLLVMESGEEGRKAFFDYLAAVYAGKAEAEGWKALGFASAEEFDGAVRGFLAGLR